MTDAGVIAWLEIIAKEIEDKKEGPWQSKVIALDNAREKLMIMNAPCLSKEDMEKWYPDE